jgi:hypothetical protein
MLRLQEISRANVIWNIKKERENREAVTVWFWVAVIFRFLSDAGSITINQLDG